MEQIQGYVIAVLFHNTQNKYTVAKVKIDQKKNETITIVGYFDVPNNDELIRFYGDYIEHYKYGRQFEVAKYEKILPNDEEAIIRFLSSPLFPRVGLKTAQKIVETLGNDCLNLLRENIDLLDDVPVKLEIKNTIKKGLGESNNLEEAIKLFVGHGISMKNLIKIESIYGNKMIEVITNNPYQLIKDIDGFGFKTVDKIALSLGFSMDDINRVAAAITYSCLQICYQTQNSYTDIESIYKSTSKLIENLDENRFYDAFNICLENHEIINENNDFYPFALYEAENGVAKYLAKYIKQKSLPIDDYDILEEIEIVENELGIKYSDEQKDAIFTCVNNGLTIITGGPGTGKTTVVNAIIKIYSKIFKDKIIKLCAPTGRASKRMSELSGHEATTIHRMLGWDLDTNKFSSDEFNPVIGEFLIVDEFSMVDVQLFYHLLKGTHPFNKILLIGDDNQLPPVSPGNVLPELMQIEDINVIKLLKIHRQSEDSGIIPLAYNVNNGILEVENFEKNDVRFYQTSKDNIKNTIVNICQKYLEYDKDETYIQVLAPMYDGNNGITNLNDCLRELYNPKDSEKKEILIGRSIYREGDKILQLKNQPDDDIYNGDIGILERVIMDDDNFKSKLYIRYDDNLVEYTPPDYVNITHAYCISVHKSQGSEYPIVIMPFSNEHMMMLKKKLIYTAVTRAKENLILVGNVDVFATGIKKIDIRKRNSKLMERILKIL